MLSSAQRTPAGRRTGRPSVANPDTLEHAELLRDNGATMAEISAKTKLTRSTLYRHLSPRPGVCLGGEATAM